MNLTATELTELPTAERLARVHATAIGLSFAIITSYVPEPAELRTVLSQLANSILNSYIGYSSTLEEIEAQIGVLYSEQTKKAIRQNRENILTMVEKLENARLSKAGGR